MLFIEQRLPRTSTAAVPPDSASGRHVATDAELRAAFSGVLNEFLAPPSTFAGQAEELIAEVCRYRPAQTAKWIAVAAEAILRHALPTAEKDLEKAVAAAVAAEPRAAAPVVRQTIRAIAARTGLVAHGQRLSLEMAARYAGSVVLTAVEGVKRGSEPALRIKEITHGALQEAAAQQSSGLVLETMAAAVRGGKGVPGASVGELAKMALLQHGWSKPQAGVICAGALRGAGPEAATVLKEQSALNLPVPFAAYLTIVCNAYAAAVPLPEGRPFDIARFITLTNSDYIPAAMIGAIAANPAAVVEILQGGLNRDLVLHGRATTREIVEAALVACEPRAPELAAAAVGRGDLTEGNAAAQIAEGIVLGTPPVGLRAALAAQMHAQGKNVAEIRATIAGALAGAVAGDKLSSVSLITSLAAEESECAAEILDQVLISAPPERQSAGIFGVLAACPKNARALLDQALQHRDLAAGQAEAVRAGGRIILETQENPAGFFSAVLRLLADPISASPGVDEAIVFAASLANPRGGPAIAAAAAIATDLSPDLALAGISHLVAGGQVARAVETAVYLKANPSDLFRYVSRQISENPEGASEIVIGAMVGAPTLGHVTAHAAALAAPDALAQIVPRLFAFSTARNPAAPGDPREEFAALVSGAVHGVIEADQDAAEERTSVTEAAASTVKSVFAMQRDRGATAASTEALSAVITAATRAAPRYALDIALVAGRALRSLAGGSADPATVGSAVLAGLPPGNAAKVADAVRAGFAEADSRVRASNVKALVDEAHDSLTGVPMTHFLDL